ncbi:MAG: alpha/beta hydrolase [Pseudomonadota bacterium]
MNPLVFVHGFMGGSKQWQRQAPLSQTRDFICLDLPGFGLFADDEPISSIEAFASWVHKALTERSVNRFDLLGHSMGGMIAQAMVRQEPNRIDRLILYGTGPKGLLPGRFESIETSMVRARTDGAEATARRISATWFLEREAAEGYPHCAEIACQAKLPAILSGLTAMRDWSGEEYLSSIAAHTLVLWGDRDRTYDWPQVERLWKMIPNANLAVVPESAHAVHAERAPLFNTLVSEFLRDD